MNQKDEERLEEWLLPKFALVNEKGEIREVARNKPTLVRMKPYFQKMYVERLQLKKLDKQGKVVEVSNSKPISSSEWLN